MTERERREGTGDAKDNVSDDLDEASKGRKKDATPEAVEEEEATGGGGVKTTFRTSRTRPSDTSDWAGLIRSTGAVWSRYFSMP